MTLTRRDLIKIAAVGGAAAALPLERAAFTATTATRMPTSAMPKYFTLPFVRPNELPSVGTADVTCPDGVVRSYPRYEVNQTFSVAEIMPGYKTPFFGYNGMTPGPTIRTHHGQPIVVNQANLLHRPPAAPYQNVKVPSPYTTDPLQRSTSTHLHGSASLPQFDGYASDVTFPGQQKSYFYPNCQEARTLWYHDHGIHHTSQNAYNGLAGMYILHDDVEASLGIPSGASGDPVDLKYDVPMIVRDATFDNKGGLIYEDNSESGVYGDVVLVNGVPWPAMTVEPRKYRFRILNASVSRSYTWQLHDGKAPVPMTVIGTDAGLMPQPQTVTSFRHGMAERYEIIVDFANYKGASITLKNLLPPNNVNYEGVKQAMQFKVGTTVTSTANNSIPSDWSSRVPKAECMAFKESDLVSQGVPQRQFKFTHSNSKWLINGETWEAVIGSQYKHCIAEPEKG